DDLFRGQLLSGRAAQLCQWGSSDNPQFHLVHRTGGIHSGRVQFLEEPGSLRKMIGKRAGGSFYSADPKESDIVPPLKLVHDVRTKTNVDPGRSRPAEIQF